MSKRKLPVLDHRLPVGINRKPPRTRGECIAGTPSTGSQADRIAGKAQCQAFGCRYNLLVAESESVPGRRHNGLAPEWTLTDRGDPGSPSCCLDVADGGPRSSAEIARLLGYDDKRRVEQIIKAALESEAGVELHRVLGPVEEDE